MGHFFKDISGFFTFPDFYAWVAEEMSGRHSPHLVEVTDRLARAPDAWRRIKEFST